MGMSWRRLTPKLPKSGATVRAVALMGCALVWGAIAPVDAAPTPPLAPADRSGGTAFALPPLRKFKAVDADNHNILINRPGLVTLLLGTSEDSQDEARAAGQVMYPLQGRSDFQLIVVVDLRNSIATWAPTIVLAQMRANLDREAPKLKPYFLKNGNTSNPRNSSCVIADFTGTICPQLDWPGSSDTLRAILFGADGREIKRWDKINDMDKLALDVRAAIQALLDANQIKATALAKLPQGTKLLQPPSPPLPLPPFTPTSASN